MATNRYTTKGRAKRIALHYFKWPHPFRRWKLVLSIVAPLLAGIWLVGYAARGDQRVYTSGPVSTAHAMFGDQCSACHVPRPTPEAAASPNGPAGRSAGFFVKVSDQACSTCHEGPVHHENQTYSPACTSCHLEHKGRVDLAALRDHYCTECHADLQTTDGKHRFEAKITSFAAAHPEFAVRVAPTTNAQRADAKDGGPPEERRVRLDQKPTDTAAIRLNHERHLLKLRSEQVEKAKAKTGMKGLVQTKDGLELTCSYCHETDASRASMQPISYAKHCEACHADELQLDARFSNLVPHAAPPLVHAYLRTVYTCRDSSTSGTDKDPAGSRLRQACDQFKLTTAEAAEPARAPGATEEPAADAPRGRRGRGTDAAPATDDSAADSPRGRPGRGATPEPKEEEPASDAPRGRRLARAEATEERIADQPRGRRRGSEGPSEQPAAGKVAASEPIAALIARAEKQLFSTEKAGCAKCHELLESPTGLPTVAETRIPVRWLPHSVFDHGVHRPLTCLECHQATASKATTDVLLPSIAVCRECHRDRGGARTACVECHLYHDKTKDRDPNGPFTVKRLANAIPRDVGAATALAARLTGRLFARAPTMPVSLHREARP